MIQITSATFCFARSSPTRSGRSGVWGKKLIFPNRSDTSTLIIKRYLAFFDIEHRYCDVIIQDFYSPSNSVSILILWHYSLQAQCNSIHTNRKILVFGTKPSFQTLKWGVTRTVSTGIETSSISPKYQYFSSNLKPEYWWYRVLWYQYISTHLRVTIYCCHLGQIQRISICSRVRINSKLCWLSEGS